MYSLIYVILSIALLALIALSTVNYLPWWISTAERIENETYRAVSIVQNAYNLTLEDLDGVVPAVNGSSVDGGLLANFPSIVFNPIGRGFSSTYGQTSSHPSPYSDLKWVCFHKNNVDIGTLKGMHRAAARFPQGQAFVNETCGSIQNKPDSEEFSSIAFTYYLTYAPDINE